MAGSAKQGLAAFPSNEVLSGVIVFYIPGVILC